MQSWSQPPLCIANLNPFSTRCTFIAVSLQKHYPGAICDVFPKVDQFKLPRGFMNRGLNVG